MTAFTSLLIIASMIAAIIGLGRLLNGVPNEETRQKSRLEREEHYERVRYARAKEKRRKAFIEKWDK